MSQQQPLEYFLPFRLARQNQALSGALAISKMARLGQYLSSDEGDVHFELNFSQDGAGRYVAKGGASADVQMQCQRCMQPVGVSVKADIEVAFVTSDGQAQQLSKEYETYLVDDDQVVLSEFIEDELILALPIVSTHEDLDCQSWFKENPEPEIKEEPRKNPFAELAKLKQK